MIQFPSIVFASFLYIKEKNSLRASASSSNGELGDLTILVPNESEFPTSLWLYGEPLGVRNYFSEQLQKWNPEMSLGLPDSHPPDPKPQQN